MTAIDQALVLASRAGYAEADFWAGVTDAIRSGGVVVIDPATVLVAYDEGDTWFVWCAVGRPVRLFCLAPKRKRFIAWAREQHGRSGRHVMTWDRLVYLLLTHGRKKEAATGGGPSSHGGVRGASPGHDPDGAIAVD